MGWERVDALRASIYPYGYLYATTSLYPPPNGTSKSGRLPVWAIENPRRPLSSGFQHPRTPMLTMSLTLTTSVH